MSRDAVIPIGRTKRRGPPAEPQSGLFMAPDGAEVYYEDTGGAGDPLFFIYGLACSIRHFKYPRAFFCEDAPPRKKYRQIWMDFRAHGQSAPLKSGVHLSLPMLVDDIKALCAFRGVEAATFFGQSMGGCIALELASRYPALVKGLVLLASPGRDPAKTLPMQPLAELSWRGMIEVNRAAPLLVRGIDKALNPLRRRTAFKFAVREVIRTFGFNPKLSKTEDIEDYLEKVFEVPLNVFYDMAAALAGFDAEKLDPKPIAPALVIGGGADRVVPEPETRRLAGLLPRSELLLVPHGSHCPHFDDPGMVCRRIAEFLGVHGL